MHNAKLAALAVAGTLGSIALVACDLDIPDLNNPPFDSLAEHPTSVTINAACTGLVIGNRRNVAAANGYIAQLGILGREAYNLDPSDPRFVGELLGGTLNKGSPFGGNFWAGPYVNIRLANTILDALPKVPAEDNLTDENRAGIRGFADTMIALDLLEVIVTHDTNGAVIDTDHPLGAPLGAIVDKPVVYAEIVRLLDAALPELDAAGKTFSFGLSTGYAGFDTPATYRKFNRAIRARVAAYLKDYPTVLTALSQSFIDDSAMADFSEGVYHVHSTKTGDLANGLIAPRIRAHPSVKADAQLNGTTIDTRYTDKTAPGKLRSLQDPPLSSDITFSKLYPGPDAPVALIRNEELILLKAEALYYTGNVEGALSEINLVRTQSGKLPALTVSFPPPTNDTSRDTVFIDALLYERRYSLLFEGHRWIDVRRFDRVASLPLDSADFHYNIRYPIPLQECNARPGEPRCALGSE
ncbi:MAG TPA: RagB/SusD family nutrient uptake outer membrane protein [Kofleriaceae bacterium]|jgi:hypothetical protein|nr:RagB/SusD family nutrient uptake outer membrane protein [Kofleriaceae bacterium]